MKDYQSYNLYPNPAKSYLHVDIEEKNLPFKIFDLKGKVYIVDTLRALKNTIDISGLPAGMYIFYNIHGASKFTKI